jgi:hypothetical protein
MLRPARRVVCGIVELEVEPDDPDGLNEADEVDGTAEEEDPGHPADGDENPAGEVVADEDAADEEAEG